MNTDEQETIIFLLACMVTPDEPTPSTIAERLATQAPTQAIAKVLGDMSKDMRSWGK